MEITLAISWKHRPRWPKRTSAINGYESVEDMRKQLRKRWPEKNLVNIPNGLKYEEAFSCKGEQGTLVYELTGPTEQQES